MKSKHEDGHDTLLWYWNAIRSHRLLLLGCLILGAGTALALGLVMTPIYRATALIMVEEEPVRLAGLQDLYRPELSQDSYYRTQVRLLSSRPILLVASAQLRREGWNEAPTDEALADELTKGLLVRHIQGTKLIEVSFESLHRHKVARAVMAIVGAFEKESTRWRSNASEKATEWLEDQLPRLREAVIAAEERLQKFQEENSILLLDGVQNVVAQRLSQLNQDFTAAELARMSLEAELRAVGESPEAIEFLPRIAGTGVVAQLDSQILALEKERADLLRTMQPDHPQVKTVNSQLAELKAKRRAKLEAAMDALRRSVDAAREKEKVLREALEEQEKKALALNEKLIKLDALKRELERAKQLYEPLLEQRGKLGLASGFMSPVRVVEHAREPEYPVKPRRGFMVAVGCILGLFAGVQLAVALERFRGAIRAADELEQLGLRPLGAVPYVQGEDERKRALACHLIPKSPLAEAFRCIRTGLLAAMPPSGSCAIVVSSAVDKEGKSTIASNIASAMALVGKRVLLVDADMRRSSIHRFLGITANRGLSNFLTDECKLGNVVVSSGLDGIWCVPAGAAPENPAELLCSSKMAEFMRMAKANYDLVVLDTPPANIVADASVLAPQVDGVLFVVRAESTPRRAVQHAWATMEGSKGKLLGAILNCAPSEGERYGYGYYYYYKHPETDRPRET